MRLNSRAASLRAFHSTAATLARAHSQMVGSFISPVLPGVPFRESRGLRACGLSAGVVRAHQKGQSLIAAHALSFAPLRPVHQLVHRLDFLMEAPMKQTELPLFGRIDAPDAVPPQLLKLAATYRHAVRMCWTLRRAKGMKPSDLARDFGFTRQHVSDYLNADDRPTRRDLPADRVADFENACGNSFVTQWLASRHHFTLLEELQAERAAA